MTDLSEAVKVSHAFDYQQERIQIVGQLFRFTGTKWTLAGGDSC